MLNNAPRFNMFKPDIIYDVRLFFGLCAICVLRLSHIMFMKNFVSDIKSGCGTRPKNMLNIAPRFNVSKPGIFMMSGFFGLCAICVLRLSHIMFMKNFVSDIKSGCGTRPKNMLNIAPRFDMSKPGIFKMSGFTLLPYDVSK